MSLRLSRNVPTFISHKPTFANSVGFTYNILNKGSFFDRKMANLVVKDNLLIDATYSLELVEQRLMLLAIVIARETQQGIDAVTPLEVCASSYCLHFEVDRSTAYAMLKKASKTLFQKQFSYWDIDPKRDKKRKNYSRWVSKISYIDDSGTVQIIFAPDVVPLITRLEQRFTSYTLSQVSKLSSSYAMRLYELLIRWKATGILNITLTELRERLGVEDTQYKRIDNFKSRVLDIAINQINEFTDIKVKFIQVKNGRLVTGFKFTMKHNQKNNLSKDVFQESKDLKSLIEKPKPLSLVWNTPENSLFKNLKAIEKNLTKEEIMKKAIEGNVDLISILNILYLKISHQPQLNLIDILEDID